MTERDEACAGGDDAAILRAATRTELGFTTGERIARLDHVCDVACALLDAPIALVTLLDEAHQVFLGRHGLAIAHTPRAQAFCATTVLHDEIFVVPDARADGRFRDNPLVTGEPGIRFYAGVPLTIERGRRVGSLCVIDRVPRRFDGRETRVLKQLTRIAVEEINLQRLCAGGLVADDGPPPALEVEVGPMEGLTGAQVRAARGILRWTVEALARAAGVSPSTVKRIEAADGAPVVAEGSLSAVAKALRTAGVEFLFAAGRAPGVRPALRDDPG